MVSKDQFFSILYIEGISTLLLTAHSHFRNLKQVKMTSTTDNRSTLMDNLIAADGPPSSASSTAKPNHNTIQDDRFYYLPADLDHIFVSIGKRCYAQINLLVLAINTISAVFSISAAVSLIEEDDDFRYNFCDYGSPVSIGVQCPYLNSPTFICFLVVWILYFITLGLYKYHRTIDYWTHDLRFYFASEAVAFDLFIQVMVKIGLVLTLASGFGGIYFVIHNGTTTSLGSIFVFMAVNLVNLKALGNGKYEVLSNLIVYFHSQYTLKSCHNRVGRICMVCYIIHKK